MTDKAASPVLWCKGPEPTGGLTTHSFDPCECGCYADGIPHCKCGGRPIDPSTSDNAECPT